MTGHRMFTSPDTLRPFRCTMPDKPAGEGHVYVVAFDSDMVKVGQTVDPQNRISAHITAAAVSGANPLGAWISKAHANIGDNEDALKAYCAARADRRVAQEYFYGVPFADVVDAALGLEYLTAGEIHDRIRAAIADAATDSELDGARERFARQQSRRGEPVTLTADQYERLLRRARAADRATELARWLFGSTRLTQYRIPRLLRAAADQIESAGPIESFHLVQGWQELRDGAFGEDPDEPTTSGHQPAVAGTGRPSAPVGGRPTPT